MAVIEADDWEDTATPARMLPHDIQAEAAVLSSVLIDGPRLDQVADVLRAEHFFSTTHGRLYQACLDVSQSGRPVDMLLVASHLRDRELLHTVGGMAYLTDVLNAAPAVANVRAYAERVRDKWVARQLVTLCERYAAMGYGDYGVAHDYVGAVADAVHAIACDSVVSTTEHLGPVLVRNMEGIFAASNNGENITGLSTGIDRYDRLTSGLHDGELTIVAARPGMGKTSLVLDWARHITGPTKDGRYPNAAIVFSLEMPRDQVGLRLLASEGRIDVTKLRRPGTLSPSEWSRLTAAAAALKNRPLWIDDQASVSLVDIRAKARRAITAAERRGAKLRLVVVDYLQLMGSTTRADSREQEVALFSRGLKALAKDLGLPVVALAQLNREIEGTKTKRPALHHLRESGAIEQDADNVCFIYRDDYYARELGDRAERNIAELLLEKQRNGPTGMAKVHFTDSCTRFDNLPEGFDA